MSAVIVEGFELYTRERPPAGWGSEIPNHYKQHYYGRNKHLKSATYQSWFNMCVRSTWLQLQCRKNYMDVRAWIGFHGLTGFYTFLEYMGERPEGTSLDRIDPNGHYIPGNMRWATYKEQANNKRNGRGKVA